MKIAIHQPEHFPYMGFVSKMKSVDMFIIMDNVKFNRRNFQHRNKLINNRGDVEWFGAQVPRESKYQLIKDVVPLKYTNWREDTIEQIRRVTGIDTAGIYEHEKLIDINVASINWFREKLKITTPMIYSSDLNTTGAKTELLISLCRAVQPTNNITYVSGLGGKNYMDEQLFNQHDIIVEYHEPVLDNNYSVLCNIF